MAKPEFKLIEKLFNEALALPSRNVAAFLENACNSDVELRAALEDLLRHADLDDQTLAGPVASLAEQIRSQASTLMKELVGKSAPAAAWPVIPGYETLEELGRGGMGVVYKVRQKSLHRIVALKMLLPAQPDGMEMLARFRTEVEALARLQHPNIITIYDIGADADRPYFTMEYIDGPSLARLLGSRPQDPIDSARLIETLARTMQAVHQHGIIHRDLKPANVLLKKDEDAPIIKEASQSPTLDLPLSSFIPKITDFGLAKDQAAAGRLTATGVTMGTPSYMAPEQARTLAGGAGPAADIYSLGSILYELLTGQPPFEGQAPVDVVNQLLQDEPVSPLTRRPRLPTDLVTICLKCLEKSPKNRYASALELAEDLRRFQAGEPIHARPVGTLCAWSVGVGVARSSQAWRRFASSCWWAFSLRSRCTIFSSGKHWPGPRRVPRNNVNKSCNSTSKSASPRSTGVTTSWPSCVSRKPCAGRRLSRTRTDTARIRTRCSIVRVCFNCACKIGRFCARIWVADAVNKTGTQPHHQLPASMIGGSERQGGQLLCPPFPFVRPTLLAAMTQAVFRQCRGLQSTDGVARKAREQATPFPQKPSRGGSGTICRTPLVGLLLIVGVPDMTGALSSRPRFLDQPPEPHRVERVFIVPKRMVQSIIERRRPAHSAGSPAGELCVETLADRLRRQLDAPPPLLSRRKNRGRPLERLA